MNGCAPVLVTVYHRLYTLKRCIEALQANGEARNTDLFIASDAPGRPQDVERVSAVRMYMHTIKGFRSVHCLERSENLGADRSGREAMNEIGAHYGRWIFLEDDICVSRYFLGYMNAALEHFKNDRRVFAICAYKNFKLPKSFKANSFVMGRYSPWGFGMWSDRYDQADMMPRDRYAEFQNEMPKKFDWFAEHDPSFLRILKSDSEGLIKAGDVRNEYHLLRSGQVCVYPRQTMSQEMESGEDSMHNGMNWQQNEGLADFPITDFSGVDLQPNEVILSRYLAAKYPSRMRRMINALQRNGMGALLRYYYHRLFGIEVSGGYKA